MKRENGQAVILLAMVGEKNGFGFYHVCTNGTVLPWMFKDEQDFVAGINRIAICKIIIGLEVWAFVLMDNHIHLLLYGTMSMCKDFIDKYKLLTGKWVSQKYGQTKHLKDLPASIIPLRTVDEVLDTIAYIDRNAIVAGFGGLPQDYPWGSASLLFRYASDRLNHTQKLESMSSTYLREILKTRITLPGDWQIDDQGMLDPVCFVEWKKVEELYKTPLKYLYHLSKKLEGKINLDLSQGQKTFIPDKEMREITKRICSQSFGHCDVRMLDVKSRLSIARTLRREYASTPKQISRMLHLEAEVLKDFI